MKISEMFIVETTEEDRALMSLSSFLYPLIVRSVDRDKPKNIIGKIGDISSTPLEILNDVSIEVLSNELFYKTLDEPVKTKNPAKGFWDEETQTIFLNLTYIDSLSLQKTITHELRHALDDYKSNFSASASTRYFTPKKSGHNLDAIDSYLAQPAEINARFAQAIHVVVMRLDQLAKKGTPESVVRGALQSLINRAFEVNNISSVFPEKTKSRDYRRLMSRAADILDKEISYLYDGA